MAICLDDVTARYAPVRMALQFHAYVKSQFGLDAWGAQSGIAGGYLSKTAGAGLARLKNASPAQMG